MHVFTENIVTCTIFINFIVLIYLKLFYYLKLLIFNSKYCISSQTVMDVKSFSRPNLKQSRLHNPFEMHNTTINPVLRLKLTLFQFYSTSPLSILNRTDYGCANRYSKTKIGHDDISKKSDTGVEDSIRFDISISNSSIDTDDRSITIQQTFRHQAYLQYSRPFV